MTSNSTAFGEKLEVNAVTVSEVLKGHHQRIDKRHKIHRLQILLNPSGL
jgi:hypothetical protein